MIKYAPVNLDGKDFIVELLVRTYDHMKWEEKRYIVISPKRFHQEQWYDQYLYNSIEEARNASFKEIRRSMRMRAYRAEKDFDEMEFFKRISKIRVKLLED